MPASDIVLWITAGAAAAAAIANGRLTAWPLIVSLAWCTWLEWNDVEFNFFLWMPIDVAVILTIAFFDITRKPDNPAADRSDIQVCLLFPIGWFFYLLPDPTLRYWVSWSIVMTQFLLTVRPRETFLAWRRVVKRVARNILGDRRDVAFITATNRR